MQGRRNAVGAVAAVLVGITIVGSPAIAEDRWTPTFEVTANGAAYAAPAEQDESTTRLTGWLQEVQLEPDHDASGDEAAHDDEAPRDRVFISTDGDIIPVSADMPAGVIGKATVELVNGEALTAATDADPETTTDEPVPVAEAKVAQAAATGGPVNMYIVRVTNTGSIISDGAARSQVDAAMNFWRAEAGSAVSSFRLIRSASFASKASTQSERCGLASGSGAMNLWNEAANAIDYPGGAGDHLMVVVSQDCLDLGGAAGIGTIGSGFSDTGALIVTDEASILPSTLAHEFGHNVGLGHANFTCSTCGGSTAYMNLYSVMGLAVMSSQTVFTPPALDAPFRSTLGLTSSSEVETVNVTPGTPVTKTLSGRGQSSGLRGVQVVTSNGAYWIDYRDGGGRDSTAFYRGGRSLNGRTYPHGIAVTKLSAPTRYGDRAIDLQGSTNSTGAYRVNESFTATGLKIAVTSVSGSSATVVISDGRTVSHAMTSAKPTIVGYPKVGYEFSVDPGAWTEGVAFTYQWYLDNRAMSDQTGPTYRPGRGAVGRSVTVRVTGTKPGYTTTSTTSAPTAKVRPGTMRTVTPRVWGAMRVGTSLTALRGTWKPGPARYSYQWYLDGRPIQGYTQKTIQAKWWMRGHRVSVRVAASFPGYSTGYRYSARTTNIR